MLLLSCWSAWLLCCSKDGAEIEHELSSGEVHRYPIDLEAGQILDVEIEQHDLDVEIGIIDPHGKHSFSVDTPTHTSGVEYAYVLARESGRHTVEVRAVFENPGGRYTIRLGEPQQSTDQDRHYDRIWNDARKAIRQFWQASDDQHEIALSMLAQSRDDWRRLGDCRSLVYLATQEDKIFTSLDRPQESLDSIRSALECEQAPQQNTPDPPSWWRALFASKTPSSVYTHLGVRILSLEGPERAEHFFQRADELSRRQGDLRERAEALSGIAHLFVATGNDGAGLRFLDLESWMWRLIGHTQRRVRSLLMKAEILAEQGRIEEALRLRDQVAHLLPDFEEHHAWAGRAWLNIGELDEIAGNPHAALEAYDKAREFFRSRPERIKRYEASALLGQGRAHRLLAQYDRAEAKLREALELYGSGPQGERLVFSELARLALDQGQLEEARERLEEVLQKVESLRSGAKSRNLRARLLETHRPDYGLMIDLEMEQAHRDPWGGNVAAALETSEQARSRNLLDTLSRAPDVGDCGRDPEHRQHVADLERLIEDEKQQWKRSINGYAQPDSASEARLKDLVVQLEEARHCLAYAVDNEAVESRSRRLDEIQGLLSGKTLLLEYYLGETKSYLWAVNREGVEGVPLHDRADLERAGRRFYELQTARGRDERFEDDSKKEARIDEADKAYGPEALALSRMLLEPVAERLREADRLIIVADGLLHYISFASLPFPNDEETRTFRPLVETHQVIYVPSASVLAALRQRKRTRQPEQTLAVIADPVFECGDPRLGGAPCAAETATTSEGLLPSPMTRTLRSVRLNRLVRLPFTGEEAEAITSFLPSGESFRAVGFEASRELVLAGGLAKHRILHFATHGLLNSGNPELSGLALSMVDEGGVARDGYLLLHEIYGLELEADLVVLSACQTALGGEIRGEGLVGLSHGFLHAGASAVVGSLWSPEDQATKELMVRFYRGMLEDGLPVAEALRRAQVRMSRQSRWSAPYYWAGFVLVGDWQISLQP